MPLPLYADECVDYRIVGGLRRRGFDVVTAADEGLLGASDEQQLARAIALSRTVVTADQDFLRLAHSRREASLPFPGVIFVLPATTVGEVVHAITLIATVLNSKDMEDWIEWVP